MCNTLCNTSGGVPSQYANISKLVKAQWNADVDRDRSELIQVRERNS
jgi:hypothetical protein